MKIGNWIAFFIVLFLLLVDFYFYRFHWLPTREALYDLQKENKALLSQIAKGLRIEKPESHKIEPQLPQEVQELVEEKPKEGVLFTFKEAELYERGSTKLSKKGKELLDGAYESIKGLDFKEVQILIAPDPEGAKTKMSARRALNAKYYLVKKGFNKKKIWAWVKEEITPGDVEIVIKK